MLGFHTLSATLCLYVIMLFVAFEHFAVILT